MEIENEFIFADFELLKENICLKYTNKQETKAYIKYEIPIFLHFNSDIKFYRFEKIKLHLIPNTTGTRLRVKNSKHLNYLSQKYLIKKKDIGTNTNTENNIEYVNKFGIEFRLYIPNRIFFSGDSARSIIRKRKIKKILDRFKNNRNCLF